MAGFFHFTQFTMSIMSIITYKIMSVDRCEWQKWFESQTVKSTADGRRTRVRESANQHKQHQQQIKGNTGPLRKNRIMWIWSHMLDVRVLEQTNREFLKTAAVPDVRNKVSQHLLRQISSPLVSRLILEIITETNDCLEGNKSNRSEPWWRIQTVDVINSKLEKTWKNNHQVHLNRIFKP